MKNSKNLKAKYYQKSKVRLQKRKKTVKGIKIFCRKKKTKTDNIVKNHRRISQKAKKQKLVENRKKHLRIWKNKNASRIKSD